MYAVPRMIDALHSIALQQCARFGWQIIHLLAHWLCTVQAAANEEVLEMLADFLPRRFPDRFSRSGSLIHNHATGQTRDLVEPGQNPLEIASLLVQVCSHVVANPTSSSAAIIKI